MRSGSWTDCAAAESCGGRAAFATIAAAITVAALPAAASADRPTSGDLSVLSGRTLGVDEVALAGGIGWPGLWTLLLLSPSPTFDVGIRADVLYGSPIMGVGTGIGGGLSVPMRLHLHGEGMTDVSLTARPLALFGEGATVGQQGVFADDFGWGLGAEAGGALGVQISDVVTLALGAGGGVYYVRVADAGSDVVGTLLLRGGVEALMARDTLLFAELTGGYGLAPEAVFDAHGVIRVSLGVAYLL